MCTLPQAVFGIDDESRFVLIFKASLDIILILYALVYKFVSLFALIRQSNNIIK